MDINYRKLNRNELDAFIEMRISQLREEGAAEDTDLRPALKDYYLRHMTNGTFVSWVAEADGKIIATSGMSFVEKPPYFGCPSGKSACFQVCSPQRNTGAAALPGSFSQEL